MPQRPPRPKYLGHFGFLERDIPRLAFSTPYTLMTWNSLKDLNEKLDKPMPVERFRPNLVIEPDEKTPFIEDQWNKKLR